MIFVSIDRLNKEPVYIQLSSSIANAIEAGFLRDGDRLPSERDLMSLFSLSATVVKKAYNLLLERHLIQRVKGKGTFVTARKKLIMGLYDVLDFYHSARFKDHRFDVSSLLIEKTNPPNSVKESLKSDDEKVIHLIREITLNHYTVMVQHIYLPLKYYKKVKPYLHEPVSIKQLLNKINGSDLMAHNRFGVINVTSDEAFILGIHIDQPAHQVRTILTDSSNEHLAYLVSYFPGDYVEWEMTIHD